MSFTIISYETTYLYDLISININITFQAYNVIDELDLGFLHHKELSLDTITYLIQHHFLLFSKQITYFMIC